MKTKKEIESRLFQLREEFAIAEADMDYFESKAETTPSVNLNEVDAGIRYLTTKEAIAHLEWVLSESEEKEQRDNVLKGISGLLNIASGLILLGLMAYIIFAK